MAKTGFWFCVASALGVAACTTAPVRGSFDGVSGTETFTGVAWGSVVDMSGSLRFTTDQGVGCSGRFVYLTAQEARGTFYCGAPQAGVPVIQTTGGGPASWVSAGDIMSLMGLIVMISVEIVILAFSLWLLFLTAVSLPEIHAAYEDHASDEL